MNINAIPVLTIDGPAGAGKGSIAGMLADTLGWHLLDSGAIYRMAALAALRRGIDLHDEVAISALIPSLLLNLNKGMHG